MWLMAASPAPLVAHVIHRLDYGGLENGLVNLINHMPAERYRHAVVCLAGFGAEFRRRIRSEEVQVVSLEKRPGKDFRAYWRMGRVLRDLRPSVVHTRNVGTVDMQWVAAAVSVRHRVHGEHGWYASDPQGRDPGNLRLRRACRPVIERYVCVSRDLARWLEHQVGVAPARIRQIYNGVDTARFIAGSSAASAPAGRVRDQRPLVIGTVGRLDPVKNHTALLRAFRSIVAREQTLGRNLRLAVVGEGPMRAELESLACEFGLANRVRFAGATDDVPGELCAIDIFVLPSLNEGISNTILEAMATGLPVVAARVGGNPEIVQDGVSGLLYAQDSGDGLESALLRYVMDPDLRRSHGAAARRRVVQNFSLEAMVQRYLDLYDELFSPSPTRGGRGEG